MNNDTRTPTMQAIIEITTDRVFHRRSVDPARTVCGRNSDVSYGIGTLCPDCEASARDATGLRETLDAVRTILSKHVLRLAQYHRLEPGHLGTFTREAIALIDAALKETE